ncbi:MAG: 4Fe-4S dicluster domain-containing protein [Nitrospiraceae bacterium]|nr:4Fe-4S dicluster domain-containing protein [Nitrospiraceae bacterium]
MSQLESKCPVDATRAKLAFFYNDDSKDGMCSKCHPCKLGIFDAVKIFEAIQSGRGEQKHVALLERIASDVKDGGMCKKGKDRADILSAFLAQHKDDLIRHIEGVCRHRECAYLVHYEIEPNKCTMCDKCREVCPSFAIEGQKAVLYVGGFTPYRIRQKRCTHCGECIKVCPEGAVVIKEQSKTAAEKEPVRTLVCTCDTRGKATGKETACSIHDTAEAILPGSSR